MKARALAHPNIALVKYWGKRSLELNLPAAGSLSLTLAGIETQTTVENVSGPSSVSLNGELLDAAGARRLVDYVERLRSLARTAGVDVPSGGFRIETGNTFPTAAGLASSASGFAALAAATTRVLGWEVEPRRLSVLARLGSGSAARSVFGGFVEMHRGEAEDGSDCYAEPLANGADWDLRCLIATTAVGPKKVSSTHAMISTEQTSPYYPDWVASVDPDLDAARQAIARRDFEALAVVAERSCLRMHAAAIAADPGVLFWNGLTVDLLHAVRNARQAGLPAFFTVDAGPHVKVFCPPSHTTEVEAMLREVEGVHTIIHTAPGPGVSVSVEAP